MALRRTMLCALAMAFLTSACSPESDWYAMRALRGEFATAVHACVPLGWNPVPVDPQFFYPGYSAEIDETDWYIPPPWVAGLRAQDLRNPRARVTHELLEKLVAAGMLTRRTRREVQYHLTSPAIDYFYDDNRFGTNRLYQPYLCYSKVLPQKIVWREPIHSEHDPHGTGDVLVERVAFAWTESADAPWARDAFVRSHSVILGPTRSPAVAKFVFRGRAWEIENIYPSLPDHLVDANVWPKD